MKPVKRILAATDYSPLGNAAVERSIMLARHTKAVLHVVHAIPAQGTLNALLGKGGNLFEKMKAGAQDQLVDLIGKAGADIATITPLVLDGAAPEVISRAANDFKPDLVVIGAHARGAVQQFFLGGTASRILARADCPVLIVRQPARGEYARVLAAVNLGPDSARVIEYALMMARHNPVTVLHAHQPPFDSRLYYNTISASELESMLNADLGKAQNRMAELIASHVSDGARLNSRIIRGHPNPVILDLAGEMNADLIVGLRHHGSPMQETIMGSIARLLAYHAPCDVLLG